MPVQQDEAMVGIDLEYGNVLMIPASKVEALLFEFEVWKREYVNSEYVFSVTDKAATIYALPTKKVIAARFAYELTKGEKP